MPYSKSKSKTKYSDVQRGEVLAILDSNGGNQNLTAKQTNIPRSTIQQWQSGLVSEDVPKIRQEKKAELSDLFENVARTYLENAVDPLTVMKTGGQQSVTAAGIAIDKMLLLRGQPTSFVQTNQSKVEHYITITRTVAEKNNATVEEVLTLMIDNDRIPPEFVEDVKRAVLLGDGK